MGPKQNAFMAMTSGTGRSHSIGGSSEHRLTPKLYSDESFRRRSAASLVELETLKKRNASIRAELAALNHAAAPEAPTKKRPSKARAGKKGGKGRGVMPHPR